MTRAPARGLIGVSGGTPPPDPFHKENEMKITGFKAVDATGNSVDVETYGNNAAVVCPCGHPVLMIIRKHQRGSSEETPSVCKKCGTGHWAVPVDGFALLLAQRNK